MTLTLPGTHGSKDLNVPQTRVTSNADFVYRYIQLANEYLWFAMVVVAFAVFVWMGYKLITNEAGTDSAKQTLKNGFVALSAGVVIVLFSYTVVRLVINLF